MTDFFRAVVDALPAAFIAIDREGRYRIFNAAAERLLGGRPREGDVPGLPTYISVFHPDGRIPMRRDEIPLIRALAGELIPRAELVIKNATFPEGRLLSASAGPVRDREGAIIGAVTAMHDLTDRAEAEKRVRETWQLLERSQKMEALGRLAGGIAHDFNNLLTVISGYAQMLEESLDGRHEASDAVNIRRAAERASGLTRQLLALGRQSVIEPRRVDVDAAVGGLHNMLDRLLGPQVRVVVEPGKPPPVWIDPGQLEQVIVNLAVNGRDAMPAGGRLVIATSEVELDAEIATVRGLAPGRYAQIAVTDTGIGMDADTQRRIFEPFFTTKEAGRGTGLGLAIVHGIVAQAGGMVSAYSELGHGTTFRIHLPIATATESGPVKRTSDAMPVLRPVTVLVVEDDAQVRAVAVRSLHVAGCTVLEAATAEEARRVCAAHDGTIAVVVSDVVLSDGRGERLAEELRALRPEIRVVFASGYAAIAGIDAAQLLAKPYTPSELRRAVANALDRDAPVAPDRPSEPRVLVVDDDDMVRRALGRLLGKSGHRVIEAASGREAVAALRANPVDVVISDVHMPDGDGMDLLRAIRKVDLDIPVILATGYPEVASAAKAIEYGVFRYLTKPFDPIALEKLVRHASRIHALARLRREATASTGGGGRLAADRAGLEVRFEAALDGLWMAFQPIVDARTGLVLGVEALARSDDSVLKGPEALLDAATRLGRLPQLGRRLRAQATSTFAPATHLTLFLNVLPAELMDPELVAVDSPLVQIANRVVLEVTERAALEPSRELAARIARLRALGYRIAVDDIGAGYSGLTSFAELTPEIVKLDMALVRDIHRSPVRQRTVRSLCELCHDVGAQVVGEGVETQPERDCLVELGVDMLQGFLLGRPVRDLPS
jgi:PAS domain S-box-containing protein